MKITFHKYQGTGNDFVIIDNRDLSFVTTNKALIERLCHRKFGVGADGLILLQNHNELNFEMIYFNADGNESSMCGNGGRCITHFAHFLNIIKNECEFMAIDGAHKAKIIAENLVALQMNDVEQIKTETNYYELNTGSPHYIQFVDDVSQINVKESGAAVRYNEVYKSEGINVNFVDVKHNNQINVRTYERGVEDETLSCGTGVTAAAIAFYEQNKMQGKHVIMVNTLGGSLSVDVNKTNNGFTDLSLNGPATRVFEGEIEI